MASYLRTVLAGAVGIVALVLLLSPTAHADYIAPEKVQVKTKAYSPENTEFEPGAYHYSIRWQGIPVARAQIIVRSAGLGDENFMKVTAAAQTAAGIDLLYTLRHTSESIFDARTLQPISFFSSQTENSKTKYRQISFVGDGNITSKMWKRGKKGEDVPEEEHTFKSDNATFDPISAAFLARSISVAEGEEVSFDVFNGKHRFLISFKVGPKEQITVRGKTVEARKVTPTVKKLTDTEGEKRLQSAALWISTDGKHDVLRMESRVLVGKVTAELIAFNPAKKADANTVRAALGVPEQQSKGQNPDTGK